MCQSIYSSVMFNISSDVLILIHLLSWILPSIFGYWSVYLISNCGWVPTDIPISFLVLVILFVRVLLINSFLIIATHSLPIITIYCKHVWLVYLWCFDLFNYVIIKITLLAEIFITLLVVISGYIFSLCNNVSSVTISVAHSRVYTIPLLEAEAAERVLFPITFSSVEYTGAGILSSRITPENSAANSGWWPWP